MIQVSLFALLHPFTGKQWWEWSIHPSTVVGLAALGALYFWRARSAPPGQEVSGGRKLLFVSGLLIMFVALNGPVHDLSDTYLFSAHMVQHLLLTMAMPPLLLAATPGWMLRPVPTVPVLGAIARTVSRPMFCFAAFNLVLIFWHLPQFYNAAMSSHDLHIVQHLMFMSAAVLMWWPLLSPLPELPRLAYPGQVLYCFLMSIPMSIVAAYITMADKVLYPAYSAAPRMLGLSPMDDQLLGGLIMWIPGGLIFTLIMTVIFFKWAARGEEDTASAQVDWKPKTA